MQKTASICVPSRALRPESAAAQGGGRVLESRQKSEIGLSRFLRSASTLQAVDVLERGFFGS